MGLVYVPSLSSFGGHMWTEVYEKGTWIPLDATLGNGGIAADHIKCADSSFSDDGDSTPLTAFLPMVSALGKMKIEVRIDDYPEPKRNPAAPGRPRPSMRWRKGLYQAIMTEAGKERNFFKGDVLEVDIILYGKKPQLERQDVDNLAKHVLDALQGRLGGAKAAPQPSHLVPNDAQFKRLTIEKRLRTTMKQHSKIAVRDYVLTARARARRKSQ